MDGDECTQGVREALDAGYRHIDTAQMYKNEEFVGEAIKTSDVDRDDIFLTTKVWWEEAGKHDLQKSVETSLEKLKVDAIDLLLIHWPPQDTSIEETMDNLRDVQEKGQTHHIGVSNFTVELLDRAYKASDGKIITNQVEFHPFIPQEPVLKAVRDHNMFLTSYSPLARGQITDNKVIKEIADKHGKTEGQVVLRWQIQHARVAAIPKAGSRDHIKENFDIFDFELSEEDMIAISDLSSESGRLIDPDFAPEWDTAKKAA